MNQSKASITGEKDYDHFVKVVIVGDSAVGKTNLLLRFVSGEYVTSHITTIGIDFKVKTINVDNKRLKIQLWDTAGQDRFRTITKTYYKGSAGIVLVFSVTDRKSFNNIQAWMSQIQQHGPENICRIIIGNKIDCPAQQREVTKEEAEELAAKYHVNYIETSAKENIGINETFQSLGRDMIEKDEKNPKYPSIFSTQTVTQPTNSGIMQTPIPQPFPQSSSPAPATKFALNQNSKKQKKKKSCC